METREQEVLRSAKTIAQGILDRNKVPYVIFAVPKSVMTPEMIIDVVFNSLNIPDKFIKTKSRKRDIFEAKCICTSLILTNFRAITLKTIADMMGGEDHSVAIHWRESAKKMNKKRTGTFAMKYNKVLKLLMDMQIGN